MAQFDVYEVRSGQYLIDCQSDLLSHLESRFTVPLSTASDGRQAIGRFHPHFVVEGITMMMVTELAGAIPARALGRRVGSLIAQEYEIKAALDMLVSGI
ncbi:CcdB family protein [Sphingomonas immobilis]|uniref:Toxin CcdB n=1 Tax=Sphingomonas immobilis TaxID=3063997 RepID=A0ABT8ZWC1_9SPHN|nr:CcdB family protein [Sphingomonas sp. CA1-15]MDO7841563.1 CcdB family protein [Sphingomonas sp. CA1-15]